MSSLAHSNTSKIMVLPALWDQKSLLKSFESGETLITEPHNKGKKNWVGR